MKKSSVFKTALIRAFLLGLVLSVLCIFIGCPTDKPKGNVANTNKNNNMDSKHNPNKDRKNEAVPNPPVPNPPTPNPPVPNPPIPSDPIEKDTAPNRDYEKILVDILTKINLSQTIIKNEKETITIDSLPLTEVASVAVTVSDTEFLEYKEPNIVEVKKLPDEKTANVIITITLTKNGTSKERKFLVKIFKSGTEPTEQDYLDTLQIPNTVIDNFDLSQNLTALQQINWKSENDSIIINRDTIKAIVTCDLVERKVTLTATLHDATKDFEITILPLTKIEEKQLHNLQNIYEFTTDSLTITEVKEEIILAGAKFNIIIDAKDPNNKTITATRRSLYDANTKNWITADEYYNKEFESKIQKYKEIISGLKNLLEKSIITLYDIKVALPQIFTSSKTSDEEIFDKVKSLLNLEINYDIFKDLSKDEQTKKLKEAFENRKKEYAVQLGLSENASIDEILNKIKDTLNQNIKDAKEQQTYKYEMRKFINGAYQFTTKKVYNKSKLWYENSGRWSNPDYSSSVSLQIYLGDDYIIHGTLEITEGSGPGIHPSKRYDGIFTDNYSKFNGKTMGEHPEEITAEITDNKNGTIELKINNNTHSLEYNGNNLNWK